MVLLTVFSVFIFFYPNTLGHPDNYIMADPLKTPLHIVPEWYFLPYYAILRSVPNKIGGVIAMGGSLLVFLLIPFISKSEIRSSAFKPIYKVFYWLLVISFFILGWIGQMPVDYPYTEVGIVAMTYYFLFFLTIIPGLSFVETYLIRYKNK
jgi:quinol-cytochrome oxidoreductase complex cytochrome b subunit